MIRTCLFLSISVLVLADAAANWRLVSPKEQERTPHHHRPHRPHRPHSGGLSSVRPSHRIIYKIITTTQAFESEEFRRQNHERIREEDRSKAAIAIGAPVGGAVMLILAIVLIALARNKRRREDKIIEKESKLITNPRYQISIINPKLRGPPPSYDNVKNGNSGTPGYKAPEYDIKMEDVKGIKFHHPEGLNMKSSKEPKFDDLYNHLNATDVQNVHQNLYKRGDSTDDSNSDEANNELSDGVEVQEPSKQNEVNPDSDDNKANTGTF